MALLNKMAYTVEKDKLVYDAKHPIDATAVQVTVGVDADGILRRGQLLDCEMVCTVFIVKAECLVLSSLRIQSMHLKIWK